MDVLEFRVYFAINNTNNIFDRTNISKVTFENSIKTPTLYTNKIITADR
jgi:hypothetical protein